MFYIKTNISNGVEIKIDLFEDEIYTQCPKCGKEIQINSEELADIIKDQCLTSTNVYCKDCAKEVIKKCKKRNQF